MKVTDTPLPGVLLIEPAVFADPRGFFLETYHEQRYTAAGIGGPFIQDNWSYSIRGTLRGLHYQRTQPQGKLVHVVEGTVYDVAVDIRRGSPTFGQWFAIELSADNKRQLYIPPGYAHGFCVTSDTAGFVYKCTRLYVPNDEGGVLWNDPELAIPWPVTTPLLSPKDQQNKPLADIAPGDLPRYAG